MWSFMPKQITWLILLAPVLMLVLIGQGPPPPEISWTEGPSKVDLGNNVAQVDMGDDYIFADAKDTKDLMEYIGNPSDGSEVGLIASKNQYENWFVVFEYNPIGYVRDDEKEDLDSKALLDSIKEGTEQANKIRIDRGFAPLHVVGWYEEPRYDASSNNLVWAILGESEGEQVVNYNTRLLGRNGYMAVALVADPSTLSSAKPEVENIISNFSYKKGKSYAEFIPGDKVAEIGLTALVAGGAGAVAAKTGLLAKFWKFIAGGAIALFAVFSRVFKSIFGRRGENNTA